MRTPAALQARAAREVLETTGLAVTYRRAMAPVTGAHVLKLPHPMPVAEARAHAERLMQARPELDYVEPDYRRYPRSTIPDDPDFNRQWHLLRPQDFTAAVNMPDAWDLTRGSSRIVMALLDQGITNHADLRPNLIGQNAAGSGYDMVSDDADGDGDGRDADPSDPGLSASALAPANWHGTHVAGLMAARPDNGLSVAGAGWNTRLLVVRILGENSGSLSDEVDGMLWAAGESVPGVPANPHPAMILNLSVGTDDFEECARTEQAAVDTLRAKGVAVVVAAGNENRNVDGSAPANCSGVLAVTGVTADGARAPFANYGRTLAVAAPGVELVSTWNTGAQTPADDAAGSLSGTSQSAPLVTATLALMLAANPKLRQDAIVAPGQRVAILESKLRAAARAFPETVDGASDPRGCNQNRQTPCVCTTATCGAGLLDAYQAVRAVSTPPVLRINAPRTVASEAAVVLDASASHDDAWGGRIVSSQWRQRDGRAVTLTQADSLSAGFTAPAPVSDETLTFELVLTDDVGLETRQSVDVLVRAATDTNTGGGSSGGGGAPGIPGLLLLAAVAASRLLKAGWRKRPRIRQLPRIGCLHHPHLQ